MKTRYQKVALPAWYTILIILLLSLQTVLAQTPVQKNGQLRVCGTKLCNQYGNPIQLRGMSTHGIQWYYQCLTAASLDALAFDWGADILRISLYVQEDGYETDPAGFTAKVTNLINMATERGMYALVDWHQLNPGDPNYNLENAKRFFTDIANTHKNKNNIIYDICNEPNEVTWARIKTYADQIIPVIRNIDADAPIFIGTHAWASMGVSDGRSAQDIVNLPVNFPNIMYTFHFYAATHDDLYLQELDWASDRLPVFVTEFGTQEASGDGPNNFTMAQRYIDLMRTKKIGWTNWNFSDDFRSGAVWTTGTCSGGPWTTARLKPAGSWVRERMLSPADDFPGGGNIPPTVNISAPTQGNTFTAPATITITANASDPDGSITKVEFFQNGVRLGETTSPPFSLTWSNVSAGSYALTVKATDNLGAQTTSTTVNITVSSVTTLPSPWSSTDIGSVTASGNASYVSGTFTVTGSGTDIWDSADGFRYVYQPVNGDVEIIARVNSLTNTNAWAKAGIMFRETLNANAVHTSTFVTPANGLGLQTRKTTGGVTEHIGATGSIPVWLKMKRTGSSFVASQSTDGVNWTTIGSTTVSMAASSYVGLAITSHANGTTATAAFTNVSVTTGSINAVPSVSITTPENGTTFTAPATIALSATATDTDGTITQVVFYQGTTPIGTDTAAPYTFTWTGAATGSYSVTARATDNAGATTTSAPVSITVSGGSSENCATVSQYVENGGYGEGSVVKNAGSQYECKPYPYSGWCNGAAWAYAPGTGTYWQDAWTLKGSCTTAATAQTASNTYDAKVQPERTKTNDDGLVLYPNPAKHDDRSVTLNFETGPGELRINLKDINGAEVFTWHNKEITTSTVHVEMPRLLKGVYLMSVYTEKKQWVRKYLVE